MIRFFASNEYKENIYLLDNGQNSILLDPGEMSEETAKRIVDTSSPISAILLTHGHFDHFNGIPRIFEIRQDIPIYMSNVDYENISINCLLRFLTKSSKNSYLPTKVTSFNTSDFQRVEKDFDLKLIETPGHTKGSVCFLYMNSLFSGDTLLNKKPGTAYWPDANLSKLEKSIEVLKSVEFVDVYPGHGKKFTKTEITWSPHGS